MIAITYITGLSCTPIVLFNNRAYTIWIAISVINSKLVKFVSSHFLNQTMDRRFVSISSIVLSFQTILKHALSIICFVTSPVTDPVTNKLKFELIDFQSIFPFSSFFSFSFYINVYTLINNKLYGYWLSQPDICRFQKFWILLNFI